MAAPLTFSGEERFDVPPGRLFAALTDLDALPRIIPDLVSAEKVDDRTLKCVVRPGFSFLRGTLNLNIEVDQIAPPESATMRVAAEGIGARLQIESNLRIAAADAGSLLSWSATVTELKGLLATISRPLIGAAAEQVIKQAWGRVRDELSRS